MTASSISRCSTVRYLSRHADGFTKGWMRVNGLADVDGVRSHLNRQRHLTNHVADGEDVRHTACCTRQDTSSSAGGNI